jgi:hypothetical protein
MEDNAHSKQDFISLKTIEAHCGVAKEWYLFLFVFVFIFHLTVSLKILNPDFFG